MGNISLLTYPDTSLRNTSQKVLSFDADLNKLVKKMSDIMYLSKGIGIASGQVGSHLSVFVTDIGDGLNIFVNPEIFPVYSELDVMEEGCLSLPGIAVNVARPEKVNIKFNDLEGAFIERTYKGLMAKVVQHENDHLYGKLIIDYQNFFKSMYSKVKLRLSK